MKWPLRPVDIQAKKARIGGSFKNVWANATSQRLAVIFNRKSRHFSSELKFFVLHPMFFKNKLIWNVLWKHRKCGILFLIKGTTRAVRTSLLVATKRLYKRVCPSVGPSVRRTLVQENDPLRQNYFPAHFRDIDGMKRLHFSCRLSLYRV